MEQEEKDRKVAAPWPHLRPCMSLSTAPSGSWVCGPLAAHTGPEEPQKSALCGRQTARGCPFLAPGTGRVGTRQTSGKLVEEADGGKLLTSPSL